MGCQDSSFFNIINITDRPISPEQVINQVKTTDSGCVVNYIGLIRDSSHGKKVISVEYKDADGKAVDTLRKLAEEIKSKWPVNKVAIWHRIGKLNVGEINFLVAVSSAHREEALAAVRFAVDSFKEKLPTTKLETYADGTTRTVG